MNDSLKNKVAFISGAAHGQGRAFALALAKEGVHIIAFDIGKTLTYPGYALGSSAELESLKAECEAFQVQCLTYVGDVRSSKDISSAVDSAMKSFDRIDILLVHQICGLFSKISIFDISPYGRLSSLTTNPLTRVVSFAQ